MIRCVLCAAIFLGVCNPQLRRLSKSGVASDAHASVPMAALAARTRARCGRSIRVSGSTTGSKWAHDFRCCLFRA